MTFFIVIFIWLMFFIIALQALSTIEGDETSWWTLFMAFFGGYAIVFGMLGRLLGNKIKALEVK